jgi:hypothetical protein
MDMPHEVRDADAELAFNMEQGLNYVCACLAQVAEALVNASDASQVPIKANRETKAREGTSLFA